MSHLGTLFYLAMGANVLVSQGMVPLRKREGGGAPALRAALVMLVSCGAAAPLYSFVYARALTLFGLESLAPLALALAFFGVFSLLESLAGLLGKHSAKPDAQGGKSRRWMIPQPLAAYGCILAATAQGGSALELMASGAAAAAGFLVSATVLEDIMDRLDLEPVPGAFKGLPARFLSAGLMALAFSGLDASFYARLG